MVVAKQEREMYWRGLLEQHEQRMPDETDRPHPINPDEPF